MAQQAMSEERLKEIGKTLDGYWFGPATALSEDAKLCLRIALELLNEVRRLKIQG